MSRYTIREYVPDLPINYSKEPYGTPYKGLWKQTVEMNGVSREMITYVPDDYFPLHRGALIFVPAGMSAEEFVNASKWVECAAKNSIILVFLTADKKWGKPEVENEFIYKAFDQAFHTTGVIDYDQKYAIGYGDSATFIARYLAYNSVLVGGAVLFGPDDIPKAAAAKAKDTHRIPIWVINEKGTETPVLTEYYKKRNLCRDENLRNDWAKVYNERMLPVDDDLLTQAVSRVWVSDIKDAAQLYKKTTWTERAYMDFLIQRYHHDHLSTTQLKVNFSLDEVGIKVYKKRMPHASFEGLQERVWSVYAPSDYDKNKAYPLVVVTHGFQCTHALMVKQTDFWKIAEKRKFIVAFTQGLPTEGSNYGLPRWRSGGLFPMRGFPRGLFRRPDTLDEFMSEVNYFRTVVEDVQKRYNIDPSRIYCTGHSNGSAMTYGLSMTMGDVFAASAQIGGACWQFETLEDMPKDHYRMPALNVSCEHDRWIDPFDQSTPLYWETLWRKVENGVDPDAEPFVVDNGTTITYIWNNADGIPVVKYAMYRDSNHSYHSGIAWYVWDEFLSGYSRGEDGTRYYGGRPIR